MQRWLAFNLAVWLGLAADASAQTPASIWQNVQRVEPGTPSNLPPIAPTTAPQPAVRLGLPRVADQPESRPAIQPVVDWSRPIEAPPDDVSIAPPAPAVRPDAPPPSALITRAGYQDTAFQPVRSDLPASASPYDPPPPFNPPSGGYPSVEPFAPSMPAEGKTSAEAFFQGKPRRSEVSRSGRNGDSSQTTSTGDRGSWSSNFGERFSEAFEGFYEDMGRRGWITSDRCFNNFISPVTNPFLAEDPRAVTEVRPLFMFQTIPNGNPSFQGGNAEWFGAQFRVAFSDTFSFVIHKLGAIAINPGNGAPEPGGFGFSEVHLGPKYTFWRDQSIGLIAASGLIFQIPTGRASVYQDTGSLSLVPYLTVGKNFWPTPFGSFNALNTTGYSFGTDRFRTDFFYNSFHLDFDWMERHRFYPLMEINWFWYTNSGQQRNLGTEGADLANIGSTGVGGKHNLLIAAGMRYKFSERNQVGIAAEFPVITRRDMNNFRLTIDYIWRY